MWRWFRNRLRERQSSSTGRIGSNSLRETGQEADLPSSPNAPSLGLPREHFFLGLIRHDDPNVALLIAAIQLRDYGYLGPTEYATIFAPKNTRRLPWDEAVGLLNEHCPPYVRFGGQMEDGRALGFWLLWPRFEGDRKTGTLPTFVNKLPPNLTGLAARIGPAGELTLYEGQPIHSQPFVVWEVR
jgi:hypothetical protein